MCELECGSKEASEWGVFHNMGYGSIHSHVRIITPTPMAEAKPIWPHVYTGSCLYASAFVRKTLLIEGVISTHSNTPFFQARERSGYGRQARAPHYHGGSLGHIEWDPNRSQSPARGAPQLAQAVLRCSDTDIVYMTSYVGHFDKTGKDFPFCLRPLRHTGALQWCKYD